MNPLRFETATRQNKPPQAGFPFKPLPQRRALAARSSHRFTRPGGQLIQQVN